VDKNFWWPELDNEQPGWCPTLQTDTGCFSLPMWFETETECLEYIRNEIVGAGVAH